jgi:hypothetical protein
MNIAYEKTYLQKMLLKSLRNFNEDSTVETSLHNALIDIEVLYSKQKYQLCLSIIKRWKPRAEEREMFLLLLQLIGWEKRCMIRLGRYDYFEDYIKHGQKRELQISSLFDNLLQFYNLQLFTVSINNRKGSVSRKADSVKIKEVMNLPLMKTINNAKSFQAKVIYYEIKMLCFHHDYQFEKAYQCTKQSLKLYDQYPEKIEFNPQSYFVSLSSLCNRCLSLEKYDELERLISQMDAFVARYKSVLSLSQLKEIKAANLEKQLMLYTYTHRYKQAIQLAESLRQEVEMPKAGYRPGFYIIFYLFVSISYFNLKNYGGALNNLRKVIDGFDDKVRLDFVFMSHILHFLTQYELGNYELLPYLAKSINRFTQSRDLNNNANKLLIRFLQGLARCGADKVKAEKVMNQYQNLLKPFKNDNTQNLVLDTLEVFKWLESEK